MVFGFFIKNELVLFQNLFQMSGMSFSVESLPVLKNKPDPRERTLEQYLKFEERSKHKHEFINKHIVKMPGSKGPHNIISMNIGTAIKYAVKQLSQKYLVFSSDQKIYLPATDDALYGDMLTVCERPLYWDEAQVLLINPLVIVDVLSKSTKKYDRGDKFMKYKTLESFREYVLIEQDSPRVETWFREEPGLWRETIVEGLSTKIALRSMGISIDLADIYDGIQLTA